jgi:hypothetical protein
MCPGRQRRFSDWVNAEYAEVAPDDLERVRWLLVAMSRASGTEGGADVARLAVRGYAVTSGPHGLLQPWKPVVQLDAPGVLHLGLMLPGWGRRWRSIEAIALATPLDGYPPRRWGPAHETLPICAALVAEGHALG